MKWEKQCYYLLEFARFLSHPTSMPPMRLSYFKKNTSCYLGVMYWYRQKYEQFSKCVQCLLEKGTGPLSSIAFRKKSHYRLRKSFEVARFVLLSYFLSGVIDNEHSEGDLWKKRGLRVDWALQIFCAWKAFSIGITDGLLESTFGSWLRRTEVERKQVDIWFALILEIQSFLHRGSNCK